MITNFPCAAYFRELAAWEHDDAQMDIEVVSHTLAPIAAADTAGNREQLAENSIRGVT